MSKLSADQLLALTGAFSLKKLPHSEVEMAGEVPPETLAPFRAEALREITADMNLPGFRKGHVPESLVRERVSDMAILESAVNHFLQEFYPALVLEKKLDAVGRPNIQVTKMTPGQPVALTIKTALYPHIGIPEDYKKIAATIPAEAIEEVAEKEFDEALEQLRKSRAAKNEAGEDALPELDDAFAQSVGSFKTLDELKEKLREGIEQEKKRAARDKRRASIIDALLEKTSIDLPQIFVESEIEQMLHQMKGDVARFGLQFEDYLKKIEKTEDVLREELKGSAERRAKLQLTLNEISKRENLAPEEADIQREVGHARAHYPDADTEALRVHMEAILRNEMVLSMLEAAKN